MAYTTIDDPSAYFHIQLYTGNNLTTQTITNNANAGDFQADWLWIKNRDDIEQHHLMDSNRGANKFLHSNASDDEREGSYNGGHNDINAFGSNGFTITSNGSGDELNFGTRTYVAWQWKANGGTTTTNDASATGVGNQDSTHQANTTSGFSIVTYSPPSNQVGTMAHGLGAVPHVMIVKCRSTDGERWEVYHHKNTSAPETDHLGLSETDATVDSTHTWNDTSPTSTIFTVGSSGATNEVSKTYVAYLFTEIQGYSKFGSYTGNFNSDGTFVYTGFKPAFLILKNIDDSGSTANWYMFDNKRDTDNVVQNIIHPNANDAASDSAVCDFLSNGFKFRTADNAWNGNGDDYIYIAFAEHPFVSSGGVPVTAR